MSTFRKSIQFLGPEGRLGQFWPVLLAAALPLGCPGDDPIAADDDVGGIVPGDLVITEIMADPEGADAGLEWFEIYNTTSSAIDLEGVVLVYTKIDGTGRKTHPIARSLTIEAGEYLVVGAVLDEIASSSDADHLDYGYADALGAFANLGAHLAIESGEQVIDEVYYEEATSGASRSFDGAYSPDFAANDNLTRWCDARTEFDGATFLATPGAANDLCSQVGCLEGGASRDVDYAAPGDFVITEVLSRPSASANDIGDWVEIHALSDFDLNGLEIGRDAADLVDATAFEQQILDAECVHVEAGDYVVFVRELDETQNGHISDNGLHWPLASGVKLTADGSLWFRTPSEGDVAGTRIDAVTWKGPDGKSTQLDPDFEDELANDDLGKWCTAALPYGDGDLGTPGAANEECAIAAPPGWCFDPDDGELRMIAPVPNGDLVITEFVANPIGTDPPAEWFEVLAKSSGDLNGLWIGKGGAFVDEVESSDCIEVVADDYLVFAHETDPAINGNLPKVDVVFSMGINNSSSDIIIGYPDPDAPDPANPWDHVFITSTSEGLSESYFGPLDTINNDDPLLWCKGDPSSPGEANPACGGGGGMGMCKDLDLDPLVVPDQMRLLVPPVLDELRITEIMPDPAAGGMVTDAIGEWFELHTTTAFDLNGLQIGKDGVVKYTVEDPDGLCIEVAADAWILFAVAADDPMNCLGVTARDYDGLSLTNDPGSMFVGYGEMLFDEHIWPASSTGASLSLDLDANVWCEGVAPYGCGDLGSPGEANPACGMGGMPGLCFDALINGNRAPVVPMVGDLVISEIMPNPNAVTDANGEWFELRALADVDLNGLEIGNAAYVQGAAPDLTLSSPDCLAVTTNETVLFARQADPLINGGLPAVDFTFSFGLTNSNAFLYIGHADALLDQVGWVTSGTGASTSLDPDFYDPAANDVADNADIAWCYETTVYGMGDKGTPDAANGQCP